MGLGSESRRMNRKHFLIVLVIMYVLAGISSFSSEMFVRTIKLSDNEIRYDSFDETSKEYHFFDDEGNALVFKGDYSDKRSTKSMSYDGVFYQLKVNSNMMYEFHEGSELVNLFTPFELNKKDLIETNEKAYILKEAFDIISVVDRMIILKILLTQLIFLIVAAAMFVNPKYYWQIGYFKRNNKRDPKKITLWIVKVESIVIALIVILFPLIRLLNW
ncbi:hypothetical protein EZV73_02120 [Acidaminobacter sp. JC074]|uniref:hypothetical protein n=1 Tax=Acidaminobacter sp. JC074 TaxID=2530199 RepID=UPI001F10F2B5|nr:hypothetical protein [Acidaminobacter sp. JC074]MCH4886342.1 hypothetical protein [Acidaminobacter sp. JC074]